jgi:O-antigen biosynthesis protein WbqP
MGKRVFDLLAVALLGVPILLLSLAIAVLVKASSPGPVLHWSKRVGRHGAVFQMPKFRTMVVGAPDVPTHLLSDPGQWITPLGAVLRRLSLDELPQLLSVIRGDMSLVGPRPALHNQTDLVLARHRCGVDRLSPGITGWAQVNGRDELSLSAKVKFDQEYLVRRSLTLDIHILWLTARKVLLGTGVAH